MVDYRDKNKSTERNRMVFIWSWLYFITAASGQGKTIQINELYKFYVFSISGIIISTGQLQL